MYRATLIDGKTYSCGKYHFDIRETNLKSQIIEDAFAILLEGNEKFKLEKIKTNSEKVEIISNIIKPEVIQKESKIVILIDWIEEATGYGNIAKKLLEKYSGTIKSVQKKLIPKEDLNLKNIPTENYVIQITAPNCFKELEYCKKRIGFTMFETTKIPKDWSEICNKTCDILIVPAKEVKKVFEECGVKIPVYSIPLWVDNSYKYYKRPKRKIFTFLFVGGIDNYDRKGWYELVKAFKQEFKNEKNVRLIFKCLFLSIHEVMIAKILGDSRIKILKGKYNNKELFELYKEVDCFVFPTHGEGFGLPPLEAMSTGLPTIVTNWMGCKEFVDKKICYPIEIDKLEEASFPKTYGDVGNWAYISIKKLRKLMRYIYENQEEAKQKGILASKVVDKKFRFKHFSKVLEKIIKLGEPTRYEKLFNNLNNVKIGFCTYQDNWNRGEVASTRIRITYVVKFMKNAIVSNNPKELLNCDVVIFQTRYTKSDLELAKKLKEKDKLIIIDLTDPHWDRSCYSIGASNTDQKYLDDMIKLADLITLPTETLMFSFEENYPKKVVTIIPDRIDLKIHTGLKKHIQKDKYTILWHGSYGNRCSIELAREDLEKLGKEFKIKLLCIYDRHKEFSIKPFKNLELECREWSNQKVIDGIRESDIAINPKYIDWKRYKSNNKTIKCWALGVSCIEFNFYDEIKKLLSSAELRNSEGRRLKTVVEYKFDSRQSARDIETIVEILISQKRYKIQKIKKKSKNDIVVYTSIANGYDDLKENQIVDNADFIAFVDKPTESNTWQTILFDRKFMQPVRDAKIFKVLSHQFVQDYKYSIWMDANFVLKVSAKTLIKKYLKDNDIAVFKHNKRSCIYQEGKYDVLIRKDKSEIIEKQLAKYQKNNHPANGGLYACGVLIRRNNKKVESFNNAWWSEITTGSERDQTSFAYLIKKLKIKLGYISSSHREYYNSEEFEYFAHQKQYERIYESGI